MLVDAGRGQEALELEETLLGYLKDDDARGHDVLEGDKAQTLVCAAKCVLRLFALSAPPFLLLLPFSSLHT